MKVKLMALIIAMLPATALAQDAVANPDIVSKIPFAMIAWVLAVFGLLKACSAFLNFVAEKTKNTWDNKLAKGFAAVIGFAGKIIDLFTANTRPS